MVGIIWDWIFGLSQACQGDDQSGKKLVDLLGSRQRVVMYFREG